MACYKLSLDTGPSCLTIDRDVTGCTVVSENNCNKNAIYVHDVKPFTNKSYHQATL